MESKQSWSSSVATSRLGIILDVSRSSMSCCSIDPFSGSDATAAGGRSLSIVDALESRLAFWPNAASCGCPETQQCPPICIVCSSVDLLELLHANSWDGVGGP